MRFALILCTLIGLAAPVAAQPTGQNAPAEKLFNEKNFQGWQKYAGDKRVDLQQLIRMDPFENHIIIMGAAPGYLVTERAFSNYELSFQWRWHIDPLATEKSDRRSGVLFHIVGEADLIWPKSIKAQLAFGRAGDLQLVKDFKLSVGSERQDPKNPKNFFRSHDGVEKPIGDWNQGVITCHGPFVTFSVNSSVVMTARNAEITKGRIALISEAGEIHFRRITIKRLEGKPVDPDKE